MAPSTVGATNSIHRFLERVLASIGLIVMAEQASGGEVANPHTEVEKGCCELHPVSEEENGDNTKGGEYDC